MQNAMKVNDVVYCLMIVSLFVFCGGLYTDMRSLRERIDSLERSDRGVQDCIIAGFQCPSGPSVK
jgi:hypothetical protein